MTTDNVLKTPYIAAVLLILSGCATKAPVSGFAPIYPEQSFSMGHFRSNQLDTLDWPKVDSLQPTLRWEPFPGSNQWGWGTPRKPFVVVDAKSVTDVSYDLKIWVVSKGAAGDVAYERERLPEPSHHLESPLKPDTEYYWSVRARFSVDGKPRVTEWSLTTVHGGWDRSMAQRRGAIDPVSYYRFETRGGSGLADKTAGSSPSAPTK
jgi:hypothetical protein